MARPLASPSGVRLLAWRMRYLSCLSLGRPTSPSAVFPTQFLSAHRFVALPHSAACDSRAPDRNGPGLLPGLGHPHPGVPSFREAPDPPQGDDVSPLSPERCIWPSGMIVWGLCAGPSGGHVLTWEPGRQCCIQVTFSFPATGRGPACWEEAVLGQRASRNQSSLSDAEGELVRQVWEQRVPGLGDGAGHAAEEGGVPVGAACSPGSLSCSQEGRGVCG